MCEGNKTVVALYGKIKHCSLDKGPATLHLGGVIFDIALNVLIVGDLPIIFQKFQQKTNLGQFEEKCFLPKKFLTQIENRFLLFLPNILIYSAFYWF